jgi:hypothetical protein
MNGNHVTHARRPAPQRQRSFLAEVASAVLLALACTVAGFLLLGLVLCLWVGALLQGAHF